MSLENEKNQNKNESKNKPAFVFWFIGTVLIVVDQVSKYFIFSKLKNLGTGNGVSIEAFKNFQFAFSLPVPVNIMFFLYAVILISIIYYIAKNFHLFNYITKLAWMLILAGAISNIGERLVLGYVRDFIFIFTGIFNLADFYIILGVLILLLSNKSLDKSGQGMTIA